MPKKIHINSLALEVTRRCNMHCAHCLRGDAQNQDMDPAMVSTFLSQVDTIDSILFTGGEPTLNLPVIRQTLNVCKTLRIPVLNFYIVTNGKEVSREFLELMIDWYVYCIDCGGEVDFCGVALSQDRYHDPIAPENVAKLRALSFYRPDDKNTRNWKSVSLIDLGRARSLTDEQAKGQKLSKRDPAWADELRLEFQTDDDIVITDNTITVTATGQVLLDCDYEYDNTDPLLLCKAEDFRTTVESHAAQICPFACDSETCRLNPKGYCLIPDMYGRQPSIVYDEGCLDYIPDLPN